MWYMRAQEEDMLRKRCNKSCGCPFPRTTMSRNVKHAMKRAAAYKALTLNKRCA